MATIKITITVPEEVISEIEKRRKTPSGEIPRSTYVTNLLMGVLFDKVEKNQDRIQIE